MNKKSSKIPIVLSLTTLLSILLLFAIILTHYLTNSPNEDIDKLEREIGTNILSEVVNLQYDYNLGVGYFIDLSFSATPDQTDEFVERICNGKLYQGYDPFNAINTYNTVSDTILVEADSFMYHSHSPSASDSIWGNRCYGTGPVLIAVDKSNAELYEVVLKVLGTCRENSGVPCYFIETSAYTEPNYINPASNFPFMIVGIIEENDSFYAVSEKICFVPGMEYYYTPPDLSYIYRSNVDIFINDKKIISGRVTLDSEIIQNEGAILERFSACFSEKWENVVHTMHIIISDNQENILHSFTISFTPATIGRTPP